MTVLFSWPLLQQLMQPKVPLFCYQTCRYPLSVMLPCAMIDRSWTLTVQLASFYCCNILITLWLPEEEYQSVIIIETLQKKKFFFQLCHESPTSFIVSRPLHIVCAVQKPCRVVEAAQCKLANTGIHKSSTELVWFNC